MSGEGKPDSWFQHYWCSPQPWHHLTSPNGFPSDPVQGWYISWILQFLLPLILLPLYFEAGVDSLSMHRQGGSCGHCLLQPFRGPASPAEPRAGTEGGRRKGSSRYAHCILVEETHVKPLARFRFGNRVAAVILKSVSGFMSEGCNKLVAEEARSPFNHLS